jgi:predicted DNA-binding protein
MSEKLKLGRPFSDAEKRPLKTISFRVDEETYAALKILEARTGKTKLSRARSELLRKLILDAVSQSLD